MLRPWIHSPLQTTLALAVSALAVLGCHSESTERIPQAHAQAPTVRTTEAPNAPAAPGAGALPSTRETATTTPTDVDLITKVESALAAETELRGSAIAVKAKDGVVTLTGSTRDPERRSMAAQVALSVDGVKLVRNELTLAVEV
ncbi:MAG: BON domain-containing protein [Burkholderiales bacterium]|nr:BON domain-containing protein [Burkholderiales bacterium]